MIAIKRILCPVDFSEFSRRALNHAVILAKWYQADIEVLYVQVVPWLLHRMVPEYFSEEEILHELQAFLEQAKASGIPIKPAIRKGNAVEEILRETETMPADLVVIGTHGHTGFDRLVLGQVTEKVLRKASCPVLTVPRLTPGEKETGPTFNQILCPVDFSPSSMSALNYALSLAQEAAGRLALLHVLEWVPEEDPWISADIDVREYRRSREEEARQRLRDAVPEEARN